MPRRFIITPRAEEDYLEIWAYIAQDNIAAADRFIDTLQAHHETLAKFPGIGRLHPELGKDIQLFRVEKYVLIYRELPDRVELLRVLHGARDIPTLFEDF
jgi:toxin ParE1/3/4